MIILEYVVNDYRFKKCRNHEEESGKPVADCVSCKAEEAGNNTEVVFSFACCVVACEGDIVLACLFFKSEAVVKSNFCFFIHIDDFAVFIFCVIRNYI